MLASELIVAFFVESEESWLLTYYVLLRQQQGLLKEVFVYRVEVGLVSYER